jgi:protein-S-isoprenylcysteine O-methyltransferase Ste14
VIHIPSEIEELNEKWSNEATMNVQPPHLVFAGGLAIYCAIRVTFQRRVVPQEKSIDRTDTCDLLLAVLVGVTQVGLPLVLLFTSWLDRANYALPQAVTWVGVPVMMSALWLFWRSHVDLGDCWSVTLKLNRDHRLITRGVYRLVRHPMYASFFLFAASQGLLLNNWLAGWAAMVSVCLLCVIRIPREEQMLLEFFGEEYRAYMQRTGRIIPRFRAARGV